MRAALTRRSAMVSSTSTTSSNIPHAGIEAVRSCRAALLHVRPPQHDDRDVVARQEPERTAAEVEDLAGAVGPHDDRRRMAGDAQREDGMDRVNVDAAD